MLTGTVYLRSHSVDCTSDECSPALLAVLRLLVSERMGGGVLMTLEGTEFVTIMENWDLK